MLNSTTSRLAAFTVGLTIAAGGAAATGAATHATPPLQDCLKVAAANAGFGTDRMAAPGDGAMIEPVPGSNGLQNDVAGLRLAPSSRSLSTAGATTWRFRIVDCDGRPVRRFDRENTQVLHLIVARTDLTGYQHLHPTLSSDGTFTIRLRVDRPGTYRAITDFVVDGGKYVLGTSLIAPGTARNAPLPSPAIEGHVDGYAVELQRPAQLIAGQEAQLTFRVTRHGQPARDLQPYLGSYGHLVALHAPELSYSHVHPNGEDLASGAITFNTELPERGAYRLFLQFRAAGTVHTVAFTQTAS